MGNQPENPSEPDSEPSDPAPEACSSACMEEVTNHCVPKVQCKKADVLTLATAAQKCQEEINGQSSGIKVKCPAPCTVSPDVLNKAGSCDGTSDSNNQPENPSEPDSEPSDPA